MNSAPAPLPVTSPAASPRSVRVLQSALWVVLGVAIALLFGLAVTSAFLGTSTAPAAGAILTVTIGYVALRALPRHGWTRLATGYVALGGVLGYLIFDDRAVRRPLTFDDLAPRFAGAKESYEVLMRYGKNHPLGKDFRLHSSTQLYRGAGAWKPADPQWAAWLSANRTELEGNWARLEPVRAWLTELNTFERIGDLTVPRVDAEIMAFAPIRSLSQHTCAIASLQAIDGHGDAALETVLPLLEVSRKLEPSSLTLVRTMIARVCQKLSLETIAFIVSRAEISPANRARLTRALAGGFGGEEGARRLVAMEYAWGNVSLNSWNLRQFTIIEDTSDWKRRCLLPFAPIAFNARRTLNLYAELMSAVEDCAARRAVEDIAVVERKFFQGQGRTRFKNLIGSLALTWAMPAYTKIVDMYWKTEDLRADLQQRVSA